MQSNLIYQPLSEREFRLVRLLPSTTVSAPLEVQVFHSTLDAPEPPYAALSYTWASRLESDDSDTEGPYESVIVNGQETHLLTNLAVALRCIRTESPQYMWADSLCIDQSNTSERSSQVRHMREIFSKATNVWAWLGPEAKDSHLAMDFLARLAKAWEDDHVGDWLDDEALRPPYYPLWEALRSLMSRSWWKRAWVVQEFALAQEVTFLCGDRRLSAHDFEAADRLLFVHFSTAKHKLVTPLRKAVDFNARTMDPARNLLDLRRRLLRGEKISALASIQRTRLTHATDPRDHLFAKLGLSHPELAELCNPDYHAEPEAIWFAFLSEYIKQKKDLYIICLAGMQPRVYHDLPSWLPDWGPSKPQYPLCSLAGGSEPQWPFFDAASGTQAVVDIASSRIDADAVLHCQGLQFDVVDGTAGDKWAQEPSFVRQSRCRENAYKTKRGAFEALCRTVISNTNRTDPWSQPPPDFRYIFAKRWQELNAAVADYEQGAQESLPLALYPRASGFERAWRSMRGLEFNGDALRLLVEAGLETELENAPSTSGEASLPSTGVAASSHPLWTALEHSAGQVCFDRCLFTTVKGYIGIGPATTLPGDKVAILLGCRVPLLLRAQPKGFQCVGESYVDGIMYGEATADLRDDKNPVAMETFAIS